MAELTTIARPYAEAVFDIAKEQKALDQWSKMLAFAVAVVTAPEMAALIANPNVSRQSLETALAGVCEKELNAEGLNMLKTLLSNGRLGILPQVAEQFEELRANEAGVVEAVITSAYPLEGAQVKDLVASLEKRFGRKVEPQVAVDAELIGGVIIQVGDEVIDASVRGSLQNMAYSLKR